MLDDYAKNGYFVVKQLFSENELVHVRQLVQKFHQSWQQKNPKFYAEKAVNSAYLTGNEYLNESERLILFQFLGSSKLMNIVSSVMQSRASFMNTQLFFNPVNKAQKNYWHRDPQYHLNIEEQKAALFGPEVIHCRIPLTNEPGLELVPGSHQRWDSSEELDVRLENNGRKSFNDLSSGKKINLQVGDLLVFSANIIHRGIYGLDRLSLDVLFCDPEPDLIKFVEEDCLPSQQIMQTLENPDAFARTIAVKSNNFPAPITTK